MVRRVLMVLFLIVAVPAAAPAEQIDGGCWMPWWNMEWNSVLLGPIAQSFIATAPVMDFVDLMLAEGQSNSTGVQLALTLYSGGLAGPIVATSAVVQLDDGANDIFRFQFDPPVELTVSSTYTFELVRIGDTGYAMVRGSIGDPCPGTYAWIEGVALDYADLWYQVGRSDAVPTSTPNWGKLKWRYLRT